MVVPDVASWRALVIVLKGEASVPALESLPVLGLTYSVVIVLVVIVF